MAVGLLLLLLLIFFFGGGGLGGGGRLLMNKVQILIEGCSYWLDLAVFVIDYNLKSITHCVS